MLTSLRQLLGVTHPLIQAPMAGSQDARLAIAVSQAGGLGSLPCATLSPAAVRAQLALIAQMVGRQVNVNFFCHETPSPDPGRDQAWRELLAPYFVELGLDRAALTSAPTREPFGQEMADVLSEFKPRVVSFHFGLPQASLLEQVRRSGAVVLSSATTLAEALWLEQRGVDAVIAQGLEAGGHRGMFLTEDLSTQLGSMALVPQLVRTLRIPVIAAGGIATAAGVAAAVALGASAVQVGTAYLLCPQAMTGAVHRAALQSDAASHTALTNLFTGRAARGIVNRVMREMGPLRTDVPRFPLAAATMAPLRAVAEQQASSDFSPLWCGQNASGCATIDAGELTQALASGFA